jgi:superfamily II DNA/RNA helicase
VVVPEEEKREALIRLIREQDIKNALVFCNRKRDVATLHTSLKKQGFNAGALHGDMSQPARMETLEKFKQGEIQILVASDVAARGLDIVDMSHVFNFDVPFSPEDYVHRIGRTGRAGKVGHSFTLASPDEGSLVEAIEKLIGTQIPRIVVPGMETIAFEASDGRRRGRGRGGRSGGRSGGAPEGSRGPRREQREPRAVRAPRAEKPVEQQQVEAAPVVAREPRPDRPPRERRPEREAPPREASTRESHAREPQHREVREPRREPRHEQRAERPPRQQERPHDRRRDRDDGAAPMGLGDHVPAFLARSFR